MSVAPGEPFVIERDDFGASGYVTRVTAPPGLRHLGSDRRPASGFGGADRVGERFECERPGQYRICLSEGRSWESARETSYVSVVCR